MGTLDSEQAGLRSSWQKEPVGAPSPAGQSMFSGGRCSVPIIPRLAPLTGCGGWVGKTRLLPADQRHPCPSGGGQEAGLVSHERVPSVAPTESHGTPMPAGRADTESFDSELELRSRPCVRFHGASRGVLRRAQESSLELEQFQGAVVPIDLPPPPQGLSVVSVGRRTRGRPALHAPGRKH